MSPGLTADLSFAGGVVLLAAWLLLARALGWRVALLLALARVGLAVVYFGYLDDGSWRLVDDVAYTEEALELGGADVLLDPEAGAVLGAVAGGRHFGYHAYNLVAFALFGTHYWAPVVLNVGMTFLAAAGLLSLARSAGWGPSVRVPLATAFLLHPDVVAWSSFFNLKDTLVLTAGVWVLALTLRLWRRVRVLDALALLGVVLALSVLRSYAVVLLGLAVVAWAGLHARPAVKLALVAAALAVVPLVPRAGLENFQPGSAPLGLVDFLLTPRPWGITRAYEFLTIPATVHWLLAPVAAWGALWLWRRGGVAARLPLTYGAVLVAFYACVPLLAGPRHRYQLAFVLASVQLAGLYALGRELLAGRLGGAGPEAHDERRAEEGEWSASST